MATKSISKSGFNPWGNDSPEKLKDNSDLKIGFKQQIKGLVNPGGMFEMLIGKKPSVESSYKESREKIRRPQKETLIFSRQIQEKDKNIQKETQEVLNNLKQQITLLEKSEKSLTNEISKIKVDQIPNKTGIYYLRYFEWLIGIIKQLRMKIDESQAWLNTFNSRKKKKIGYWKMYKKHGTSFGLSHERSLSTQTG